MNNFAKYFAAALLPVIAWCLTACGEGSLKPPTETVEDVVMSIYPESSTMKVAGTSTPCMMVMDKNLNGMWRALPLTAIEGFNFVEGHAYTLSVRRTGRTTPTQAGDYYTYKLLQIIEDCDTVAAAAQQPAVTAESEIRYAADCPHDIFVLYNAAFWVDKDRNITYLDGSKSPSYETNASLTLVKDVDVTDENYLKWIKVAYMARLAYVIDPSTAQVTVAPVHRNTIYLKHIIPENVFDNLVANVDGQKLTYQLILANIYGQGIQKMSFSITKEKETKK